jgi:hypothetical protein
MLHVNFNGNYEATCLVQKAEIFLLLVTRNHLQQALSSPIFAVTPALQKSSLKCLYMTYVYRYSLHILLLVKSFPTLLLGVAQSV